MIFRFTLKEKLRLQSGEHVVLKLCAYSDLNTGRNKVFHLNYFLFCIDTLRRSDPNSGYLQALLPIGYKIITATLNY